MLNLCKTVLILQPSFHIIKSSCSLLSLSSSQSPMSNKPLSKSLAHNPGYSTYRGNPLHERQNRAKIRETAVEEQHERAAKKTEEI